MARPSLSKKPTGLPTKKELIAFFKSLTPQQLADLDKLILSDRRVWLPNPGPQTKGYYSSADQLFYGGQAGGGKTDLLLGLSATQHHESIIFRREYPQLRGIERRLKTLFVPHHADYNKVDKVVEFKDGRILELGAVQHFDDREKYQGRPHDLKAFDEITHFLELQYRYLIGWNRTTRYGQRTRVVCAGNPPTSADGRWVIQYWAPWIDDKYPNPKEPGELAWFVTDDEGRDTEVEGPGEYTFKGETYEAHSRTFLPSSIDDNPYLNAAYKATLSSLPEPLRSQLLKGDFRAGIEDAEYQLIPTDWVRQAQRRWRERKEPTHLPVQQLGVDVARGGRDNTVLTKRKGNYFLPQEVHKGVTTKDGQAVATLALKGSTIGKTIVVIDATGVGSSPLDFLRENNVRVIAYVAAQGTDALDKTNNFGFANLRSESYWRLREALDPTSGEDLAIPDEPQLLADLTAPTFKLSSRGVQVESKDDIKKRIGRSTDFGDSLVYAHCNPNIPGQGVWDFFQQQVEVQSIREALAATNPDPNDKAGVFRR
jgi:hypothetical protein